MRRLGDADEADRLCVGGDRGRYPAVRERARPSASWSVGASSGSGALRRRGSNAPRGAAAGRPVDRRALRSRARAVCAPATACTRRSSTKEASTKPRTGGSSICAATSASPSTTSRRALGRAPRPGRETAKRSRLGRLLRSTLRRPRAERGDMGHIARFRILTPLRHRDFRLLWTGMTVSLLGDGIFLVGVALAGLPAIERPDRARGGRHRHVGAEHRLPARRRGGERPVRPRKVMMAADLLRGVSVAALRSAVALRWARAVARHGDGRDLRRRNGVLRPGVRRDSARAGTQRTPHAGERRSTSSFGRRRGGCWTSARRLDHRRLRRQARRGLHAGRGDLRSLGRLPAAR